MTATAKESISWNVVALLFAAFALCYLDRQAAFSIFPVLKRDLGFSDTQLGLVGSLFGWSYALSMPVAGRVADILRRDRLVIASLVLWSFAALGTASSGSPAVFLLWRVVMGLTESLYFPAAVAIIAVLHRSTTRSRAMSIHQAAQLAGIIAGGWYGGWAAERLGWRGGFMILCIAGIAYSLILFKWLGRFPAPGAAARRNWTVSLAELLRSPLYVVLGGAFFFFCAVLWIVYAWLPDLLYERFGLSLSASGLDATLYVQASCAVGVLAGGWIADRLMLASCAGRLYVVAFGMISSAPCAYLACTTASLDRFRICAILFGLLAGLAIANIFAAAYDVVAEKQYGFAAGTLNMVGGISGGGSMLLMGIYKEHFGTNQLIAYTAVAGVLSASTLLAFARLYSRSGPGGTYSTPLSPAG